MSSHLPCHCQQLLPCCKVLQNERVLIPEPAQTLCRGGWGWSCRARPAGGTHTQLCHLPVKTTSGRGRGGKAAVRWQGWDVTALIPLWVSWYLRKWKATLKNHLWGRQAGTGEHHIFQSTWFSNHCGFKSHMYFKGTEEQASSVKGIPLLEERKYTRIN